MKMIVGVEVNNLQ